MIGWEMHGFWSGGCKTGLARGNFEGNEVGIFRHVAEHRSHGPDVGFFPHAVGQRSGCPTAEAVTRSDVASRQNSLTTFVIAAAVSSNPSFGIFHPSYRLSHHLVLCWFSTLNIRNSLFHSRLKNYLLHRFFPPSTLLLPHDWLHRLTRTISSELYIFLSSWWIEVIIIISFFLLLFLFHFGSLWRRYGDGAGNTVENSSVFSLIRMV